MMVATLEVRATLVMVALTVWRRGVEPLGPGMTVVLNVAGVRLPEEAVTVSGEPVVVENVQFEKVATPFVKKAGGDGQEKPPAADRVTGVVEFVV